MYLVKALASLSLLWVLFAGSTPQKQSTERRKVDRKLATKIGFSNALAWILVISSPMIVDPRLTTHVHYQARHYNRWIWLLTALAIPVYWTTKRQLEARRVSSLNYLRASLPLVVPAAIVAMVVFPPERPHRGALMLTLAYASLAAITVACRQSREGYGYVEDSRIEFTARLERLKATVSTWQMISIYGMAAYIGFVAVVLSVLWTVTDYQVTAQGERYFLGLTFIIHMALVSFFMALGPLHECFAELFESVRKLSSIREHLPKEK
jgi:hypothetical protein